MQTETHHSAEAREVSTSGRPFPTLRELIAAEKTGASSVRQSREYDAMEEQGAPLFVSLDRETRVGVETDCAAYHLNRRPQTLRCWAAFETGPLRPLRINGRLMWPTAALRKLCGVAP
jgi:hypothetical protein